MSRSAAGRSQRGGGGSSGVLTQLQRYFANSELPLTILLFLLPMLVFYEVGTRYLAYDWVRQAETRVLAFSLMRRFMAWFGAHGRYLPLLGVVGILLTWHIARRDPWRFHFGTTGGMFIESALLALPLLSISALTRVYLPLYAQSQAGRGGFIMAFGAGVYEELVFRLAAFTLMNIMLIDLMRVSKRSAYSLMIVISSVMFAAYHYWSPLASGFLWSDFVFRTIAGVYFGTLFIARGFGVTAGCHVVYDIYYFILRG